jgi:molybdenum cofactor biosynthesis enzyme MoaA
MTKIVYVNDRCNQNCVFCLGKHIEDVEIIFDKIKRAKNWIIISGGEPLLNFEKTMKILVECKRKKEQHPVSVEFQSNGVLFHNEKLTKKIIGLNVVDEFNINFPSHQKELDEKITKTNYFHYRMSGVNNILKNGGNVRLTFVINLLNYKIMHEYLKYFQGRDVSIQFSFIQIDGKVRENLFLVPKYNNIKPFISDALEYAKINRMRVVFDNIPLCILPRYKEFSVDFNKSIKRNKSFYLKSKIEKCRSCSFGNFCFGPPKKYTELFGHSEIIAL